MIEKEELERLNPSNGFTSCNDCGFVFRIRDGDQSKPWWSRLQ